MTNEQYISLKRLDGIVMESKSYLESMIKECITPLNVATILEPCCLGYRLKITNWDKLKVD